MLLIKMLPLLLLLNLVVLSGCKPASLSGSHAKESVYYSPAARIKGFDPVLTGDVASILAMSKVYEGLFQYAYLERPYRLIPLLAEAMPQVSGDGLTYTIAIRKNIHFQHNPCFTATSGRGRELTAADFVYSIKRLADQKNMSSGFWTLRDRIVGLDDFREASKNAGLELYDLDVPGLRALDRYTLQIHLKRPFPQLLWILAMHYTYAVPHEAVMYYGNDFLNHPVGTGPFQLVAWQRNYRREYVRNPAWNPNGRAEYYPTQSSDADRQAGLLTDAGQPLPFIDRVVQFVVADGSTQWMMFLAGQFGQSAVSRDNWDAVITASNVLSRELRQRGIRLHTTPTLDVFYIGFNMDDPVVGANKKLRQAMHCAFDGAAWEKFYNYRVKAASGPVPTPLTGSRQGLGAYGFDPNRARRLLSEAGYPQGKDPATGRRLELMLEVADADSPELRQSTDLFIAFMADIGLHVKASYNNRPAFFDKISRRQAQMFRLSWIADYPDAENFLQLFYSKNSSPGSNRANYSRPAYDRLYEKARRLQDNPERDALYTRMADMVIEDCPWIFLHQPMAYTLSHPWVTNVKPHAFPYGMLKYLNIGKPGPQGK